MRNTRYGIIGQRTRMLVAVHRSALCPDAHLARREMTVTLRELLSRVPGIMAGEPAGCCPA
jgi:hypothetical protein